MATTGGTLQLIDVDDVTRRQTLASDLQSITCLTFSPDSQELVVAHGDVLRCFDVAKSDLRELTGIADAPICSVAFSHDGQTLALGRQDGVIQIHATAALAPHADGPILPPRALLAGHLDRVAAMCFSPDDRTLASGSWDTTVRLWHMPLGQEVAALKGHHGEINAVEFSPCGKLLASGGQRDGGRGEVLLWRSAN